MSNLECVKKWWNNRDVEDSNAYVVSIEDIKKAKYNLDFKNPNMQNEEDEHSLDELLNIMKNKATNINNLIDSIKDLLEGVGE